MRLLGITDLHGSRKTLGRILSDAGRADAILLGGDITHFGSPDEAESLVEAAQAPGVPVLAVAGNCDSARIDARLAALGVSLAGRGTLLDALGLHGLSAIPPWIEKMYQASEEELAAALEAGFGQIGGARQHGVLSHVPPHGLSVDRIFLGRHVGSTALAGFVARTAPLVVLCGHIHEARGVARLGPTTVVNCGHARKGHYALVDLDAAGRVAVDLRRA